jgi:hypothetical protein
MDAVANLQNQNGTTNVQTTPDMPKADAIDSTFNPDSVHQYEEKRDPMPSVVELDHGTALLQSQRFPRLLQNLGNVIIKFVKFMGPGAIISVAYIDPDNFQTAISAGAQFKYKLLFMILLSNIIAVYLQVSGRHSWNTILPSV